MSKTLMISLRRICIVFSFVLLMGPPFIMKAVAQSYPLDLSGATQKEASVIVNVYKPVDAVTGILTLSTYDADFPSEGELVINGNAPIVLFGSSGVRGHDKRLADITISTPASYWNDGDNTLLFRYTKTAGYSINGVAVLFDASSIPDPGPAATLSVAVLHADFNDRTLGLYERRDLEIDFQVGQEGYNDTVHGPDWNSTFIVNDPAGNTGRDKVLEVKHFAGTAGSSARAGGMRFRADFSAADEYYFAFDAFVPSVAVGGYDFWFPLQHKQPAMIYGDLLAASHATGEDPLVDGITGFNSRTQFYGQDVFGRGEGSGSTKPLTALDFLESYFWDTVDPARDDPANTYNHPLGRWITIEQRVKMNTADDSNAYDPGIDLADGVLEVWITDPAIGWYGKKVVERLDIVWRFVNTMTIDGLYMYDHYGGNPDDPRNRPPQDQSKYYDNFIVSPSPITH